MEFIDDGAGRISYIFLQKMIAYNEQDIKDICLILKALEHLNERLHSGTLATHLKDLEKIIDKGRMNGINECSA